MQLSETQNHRMLTVHRGPISLLILAHVALLVWWYLGAGWWAVLVMMALHAALLWGTLNPSSTLFGPVLKQLPVTERCVYLTIDDGPSNDTSAMLATLAAHQATATFFVVGQRAAAQPEQIKAVLTAGHSIGNHTYTHPSAVFWCLLPARMRNEILTTQQTLEQLTGQPVRWFRSVAGHTNPFVNPVLQAIGSVRVGWSARGFDAVSGDIKRVVKALTARLQPGQILLLHEGAAHGQNVAMLAALLNELARLGYVARALPILSSQTAHE